MSKVAISIMTVLCIGLASLTAQGALVNYTFNETSSGQWNVLVQVSGTDTVGLSAYSIWVNSASGVDYTENVLGTIGAGFAPIGFSPSTEVEGYIAGKYNAGNFQSFGSKIAGIGKVPVDNPGIIPGTTPHVLLGVPALLGTLSTPAGLHLSTDLYPGSVGLFNADGTGYLASPPTPTWQVNSIPEPVTLLVLALGGLAALLRRRST